MTLNVSHLAAAAVLSLMAAGASAQYRAEASIVGMPSIIGTTPQNVTYSNAVSDPSLGSVATGSITYSVDPIPSIQYAATAFNPVGQIQNNGGGSMTYGFEVFSAPSTNVPINFAGLFSSFMSSAGSGAGAFTQFSVQTVNSPVSTYSSFASYLSGPCGAPSCFQVNTFNATYSAFQSDQQHAEGAFQGTVEMLTNTNGQVTGSVMLYAGGNINLFFNPASLTSFIDPQLVIDPAFLAANPGSTLTITPGVGNGLPPVPEPHAWALLVGGMGLLATIARRRKAARQPV